MTKYNLCIRHAEWRDEEKLIELQTSSLRTLGAGYYEPESIESFIKHVGTMDRSMLTDRSYFVAQRGEQIVGCGGWSRRRPNYAAVEKEQDCSPSWPLIRAVYVDHRFVRQGIGRLIMAAVEEDMAAGGIKRVMLTATLMGVPLYRKIGFHTVNPVTLYFPDGERFIGIAMEKTLPVAAARPGLAVAAQAVAA